MCETKGLMAGFAKMDITPDYTVGLGGYSNAETRRNVGIAMPIYATCIALREGEETILVYTIDNCACGRGTADEIREVVGAATGIPGDKMFFGATHTHNAPSIGGYPEARMYRNQLYAACARAAQLALEDLAPAKTLAAKKSFPGWNNTRHVRLENGVVAGYNWRTFESPIKELFGPADHEMVLIKFDRGEEKKSILMINWQGHPDCSKDIGFELIAPSYPGPLRDTVEAGSGMHVAFFTGADGNMIIDCRVFLPEQAHNLKWRRYGVKIGSLALELLDELQEVEGSGIATKRHIFEAEVDHSWDHMLEQANEVYDLWKATDKKTGDALGKKYNFSSSYQARAIRSRAAMGKTIELETNAFRVGGIGFTTGTYEMFAESGMQVKEGSPYDFTFVITGNSSYIPAERNFEYRCYEADTGFYAIGTAEKLVDNYIKMLKEIQ
jgi:hypothetical protein